MIWYFPLEYVDNRYTQDMDITIQKELKKQKKKYQVIGKPETQTIQNKHDFLNSTQTSRRKLEQIKIVTELFEQNKIMDGDTFFFADIWHCGIEAIPYMAYFNRKTVSLCGILHAGSFTPSDFVANMKPWAKNYEKAIIQMCNKIFLGSNQPKADLISQGYIEQYGNLFVTGIPIDTKLMHKKAKPKQWKDKKDIVLFTGRLADEKQPFLFDDLATKYPEYQFIKTQDLNLNKTEYYELLSKSKACISFALQENYGIAAIECAAYGVNLLLPNRLSYKDLYPQKFLYNNEQELHTKLKQLMSKDNTEELQQIAKKHDDNAAKIVELL